MPEKEEFCEKSGHLKKRKMQMSETIPFLEWCPALRARSIWSCWRWLSGHYSRSASGWPLGCFHCSACSWARLPQPRQQQPESGEAAAPSRGWIWGSLCSTSPGSKWLRAARTAGLLRSSWTRHQGIGPPSRRTWKNVGMGIKWKKMFVGQASFRH